MQRAQAAAREITGAVGPPGAEVAEEHAVYTLEMSARRQEGFLSLMDRTP